MYKGIIFDMDNTLLQSMIDFKQMREALIRFIVHEGLSQYETFEKEITPTQVIERGKRLEGVSPEQEKEMWEIVTKHEALGMKGVRLEEGVLEGLKLLKERGYRLAVVTNNAYTAACTALEQTKISSFFECIVGREQMKALKPSPSGIVYALQYFSYSPEHCVMVGDSWIDGKAAMEAKVDFIAYKTKAELLEKQQVEPILTVNHFYDLVKWFIPEQD